jgi:enamine deaminase RidA (YjgF/YER057c/UK114 family)
MDKRFVSLGEGVKAGMSAAVRFGDCIAVSGQVAMDETGQLVGKDNFAAQAEQCFANLVRVLGQAGGSLTDVVSLTTYLTAREYAPAFLAARARHFPTDPPATTTVIAQLMHPDFLIEVQALAAIGQKHGPSAT